MIANERDIRHTGAIEGARRMMTAARTAPKGKGLDLVEIALIDGDDKERVAVVMEELAEEKGMKFFLRDAANLRQAECAVIIGTHSAPLGLDCGHCGYPKCAVKPDGVPCAINSVDVGIALGSACATAADLRLDTRVMFSAGLAAERLDLLPGCRQVYAILVSASSKNPFFDRKSPQPQS